MNIDVNTEFYGMRVEALMPGYECAYRKMYEATDAETGEKRTLVVYDSALMPSEDFQHLPDRELKLLQQTDSHFFPRLLSHGEESQSDGSSIRWFALDHHASTTLRSIVEKSPMSATDALRVIGSLTLAIHDLENIYPNPVHCNISPDTIRIYRAAPDAAPEVLVDGLQFIIDESEKQEYTDKNIINRCTCAPEVAFDSRHSQKTMEYALGMLYVYMLTGSYAYGVREDMDVLTIYRKKKSRTPSVAVPDCVKKLIIKALSTDPHKRIGNIQEMFLRLYRSDPEAAENLALDISALSTAKERDKRPSVSSAGPVAIDSEPDTDARDRQAKATEVKVTMETQKGDGFAGVAGMTQLKQTLKQDFIDIIKNIDMAKEYGINVPGMMLYGPPGNGKTHIAKKLGEELGIPVSYVCPSDLGSIYIHGSQGLIKDLFEKAAKKAKKDKGCLLIIDEIDAVCPSRTLDDHGNQSGEVAEFLSQMNTAASKGVYVVACTNLITRVDKALLRTGRLDKVIYVPLPDFEARKQLFEYELMKRPHDEEINYDTLANKVEGFTSSDITYIVGEAARRTFSATIEKGLKEPVKISEDLIVEIIKQSRPSVTPAELREYEQMRDQFAEGGKNRHHTVGFNI